MLQEMVKTSQKSLTETKNQKRDLQVGFYSAVGNKGKSNLCEVVREGPKKKK